MQQLVINKVETDENFRLSQDKFAANLDVNQYGDAVSSAITAAVRQVSNHLISLLSYHNYQVATLSKSKAIVAFTSRYHFLIIIIFYFLIIIIFSLLL
jgi:hypothetical protein